MRDQLCYQAIMVYKQNEAYAHSLFVQALQYPYEFGSPWTDAQIYSNMGMSCGNDYATAYRYLQKAISLGLSNPSIIKEINWIETHYKDILGIADSKTETYRLDFYNYSHYAFLQDVKTQKRKHTIDLTFSHNRKKLSINIYSDLSPIFTHKATLTEQCATKVHDIYMGDNPNILFYVEYGPFEDLEKITVLKRDTNEKTVYFN